MGKKPKIYLGGPDVFLPDAEAIGRRMKEICAEHGLEGLYPCDNVAELVEGDARASAEIVYSGNVELMDLCDAMIADMAPFRGAGMDAGTCFEMGYVAARGKPVVGWTDDPRTLPDRVKDDLSGKGRAWRARAGGGEEDDEGVLIEDFGLSDNLMPVVAVWRSGMDVVVGSGSGDRLAAFKEACAVLARRLGAGA